MRIILTILSFLLLGATVIPPNNYAVSPTYVSRYFSAVDAAGSTNWYQVLMPIDSASRGKTIPWFIQLPGSGETGGANNTQAKANLYGVTRDVYTGVSNGRVWNGTDSVLPGYVVIQRGSSTNSPTANYATIKKFLDLYANYIDTFQLHLTGISLGGKNILHLLCDTATKYPWNRWATVLLFSAGGTTTYLNDRLDSLQKFANAGGKMFITKGATDGGIYSYTQVQSHMNGVKPGSCFGRDWQLVDGFPNTTHCCWDVGYQHNRTWDVLGGKTVYEFSLQNSRAPVVPPTPKPTNFWKKLYQRIKLIQ